MGKATTMRWLAGAVVLLLCPVVLLSAQSNSGGCEKGLSPDDVKAIKATIEAYRTSWLNGDSKGVLSTFAEDAVLLPHHGDPPVQGIAAIQNYWFGAGGPPTTITGLNITVEQVGGSERTAFARGLDAVSWTMTPEGKPTQKFSNSGTYLNVMKKMPDGSWRIQAHMWDDPANRAD
ncbi:MAG: SgcJ/EcaC family oxidoreductase [Acidobacteriia bacterium]|nr:SgcJ/EcaC family oxidoreductase [Terriglobia bacterium]